MMTKTFRGTNVFMSRNLVPPELFDTLHDALKQNGADIFLCCDPSRNGPNDYHVISSNHHVYTVLYPCFIYFSDTLMCICLIVFV